MIEKGPTVLALLAVLATTLGAPAAEGAWIDPALEDAAARTAPGEDVAIFALLDQQLNLPELLDEIEARGATLADRHYEVVTRSQALAGATQGSLLAWLEEQKAQNQVSRVHAFWITNAVAIKARPGVVAKLAQRPEIKSLYLDYGIELIAPVSEGEPSAVAGSGVENNIAVTGAQEMWALGFDGTGTLACHQDTGVDGTHPAFADRWRGLEPGVAPQDAWFDPINGQTFPSDSDIHGTHTMGTMVGDDGGTNQIGMAPGAQWIGAKTIDVPGGNIFSDAVVGFEWAADPDGDPTTMDDVPDVVSNSWGLQVSYYGSCLDDFNASIDALEAAGPVVIFAAGNEGSAGLRSPANRIASDVNVFAVGALNQDNTTIASFSSRGPSDCDNATIKPEISAVGVSVRSSFPGGGYGTLDGTSMAAPAVSGAVLLLRHAFPEATPEEIKTALYYSAEDLGSEGEDNTYGMGRLNVYEAYLWLKTFLVNSKGRISMDELFRCGGSAQITVADIDLTGPSVDVRVTSELEPDGEIVQLQATQDDGIYAGTVALTAEAPESGDGALSVSDADSLVATYVDADDGEGGSNIPRVAEGTTDCVPPVFGGLLEAVAGDYQVSLSWDPASDANGVGYNVYRAGTSSGYDYAAPLATVTALEYLDETVENGESYYYVVRAHDNLGQEEVNAIELNATPFGPDRLFRDIFDDAENLDHWTRELSGRCAGWRLANCGGSSWCSGTVAFVDHGDCFPFSKMDAKLISPAIDVSSHTGLELRFNHYFDQEGKEIGDVDYSLDGSRWTTVKRFQRNNFSGEVRIDLSALDGQSQLYVRFRFYEAGMISDDWGVDDVELVGWPTE